MDLSPSTEIQLRKVFKLLNRFMLMLFRLGLARYGNSNKYTGWIMVIKYLGHKSGLTRYAPVNFFEDSDYVYCTAGFGPKTHWYRNLRADPRVELWLPNARWAGTAEDISDDPDSTRLLRKVLIASGFAGPFFGANPRSLTDEDLERMLSTYRLMRIRKEEAVTGPGGPGDLAWIWPLTTFIMAGLLVRRQRKSK